VLLTGDEPDLSRLTEGLSTGDVLVSAADGERWLVAAALDELDDVDAVKERAEHVVAYLNGLAKIRVDDFRGVSVGGLKRRNGEDHHYRWVSDSIRVTDSVALMITREDGTVEHVDTSIKLDADVAVACRDERVQRALRLFGAGDRDWRELYKVLEVIEADVGGARAIVIAGWADEAALRRFKHTANSLGALGDGARHAAEVTQPPKDPMPLEGATAVLRDVLRSWIESKT